ncbi:MAG: FG-GAP-like repeat-containing protein, partial [Candidatus Hodarchaeota archaeon]
MKDISLNRNSCFLLLILCLSTIVIIGSLSIANPNNEPVFIELLETQSSPEFLPHQIETKQHDELDIQTSPLERIPKLSSQLIEDPKIPQEFIHFSSESHPNLTHIYSDPGFGINAIAVDDFNLDSVPDIVAGAEDLYVFNGATGELLFVYPGWITTMALGDLSRDGIPDIVVSSFETIKSINGATGETLWTNTDPTDSVYALDLADFNNDAILDVAAGSWDNTIYVINGATGGILWTNTDATDDITVLDIADFTQDAIPDIVTGSRDENVYFVNGATGKTLYINSDPESNIAALAVADFNTDGTPDVAAASRWWDGLYFINGATGETLWTNSEFWELRSLAIGDFNKDSTPDVAVGASETINFVNGATGETLWTNYEPRESIVALMVADFTQDSIPDVVAGSEDTNIYRINGATGETLWTNSEPTDYISALTIGDFNNDDIPDVVAGSEDSNVYILDSDHVGPILQYCQLPNIPSSIKPLDFQLIYDEPNVDTILMNYYSDGEINIITPRVITANRIDFSIPAVQNNPLAFWFWANDTWGNIRIQGNKTNSYQLPISLLRPWTNTDPSYSIDTLAVDDFNNDSILDIVAGAENIYFIDGATEQILYQNYAWCLSLAVGDFNADSTPDVAVADFENIYFIDGGTGTTLYQNSDPQDSVYALALADFNQDTIPDVAAGSWDSNIYFIDGATGITLYVNTEPTGWVEALVVGDFNQDSIPDVAAATNEQDT